MSVEGEGAKRKWKCKYCTYENFPSSLKCTMCREEKVPANLNSDIYELADAGPSLCTNESKERDNDKALVCSERRSVSPRDLPLLSASPDTNLSSNKQSQLTVSPNSPSEQHTSHPSGLDTHQQVTKSVPTTTTDPCGMKTKLPVPMETNHPKRPVPMATNNVNNLSLKPLKISESPPPALRSRNGSPEDERKWSCVRCTYENWPRAGRCVMCHASPRISPLTAAPTEVETASAVKCDERRSAFRQDGNTGPYSPRTTAKVPQHHLHTNHTQNYEPDHRNNYELGVNERRLRRKPQRAVGDWCWLNACSGIVSGDYGPVHAYLAGGGDPARQLTPAEVALLNRSSAFHAGLTLVHLAIRFQREDILATLLSQIEGSGSSGGVKRVPSYVAPDLAADIRRHVAACMRQRKSSLPCVFVTDIATFTLPAEIEDLPPSIQEQLFEELLDKEAQQQLEAEPHPVINWSHEVTAHLYALWNRSAGDCLLDSLMQTTWGVFDRENVLRRALADSLVQASHLFYARWKEYEDMQASLLHFSLDEAQWQDDWASLVSLASQPGAALEQLHVFVLAHILRRPIIVYGVKYVKSFRGEDIGYARFEGVYLPFLWDPGFCSRSPLSLGYTRGHFSALIPVCPSSFAPEDSRAHHGARNISPRDSVSYLPLMDHERKLLPIHFVTHNEIGREETLLKQWLDVGLSESGLLVAQQRLSQPPLLVAQMVEEWLNHYRRLQQMSSAPFSRPIRVQDFSSDESDGEE